MMKPEFLEFAAATELPDQSLLAEKLAQLFVEAARLPLLMTIPQVMEALQISRRTVYESIRLKKLELARPGIRISRITTESVLAVAGTTFKPLRIPRLRNQQSEDESTAQSSP